MRKKIYIVLAFMLALTPISATTITDKKNQLSSAQQDIEAAKEELEVTKEEKAALQKEVEKVDNQIVAIQDKILELQGQLEDKEEEIAKKEAELEIANAEKDEQYENTKKRMVQMYKNQKVGYLQVIFSSSNFWEAINRLEYVKRISNQDNQMLEDYEAQIKAIDTQKKEIEDQKAELDILYKAQVAKQGELEEAKAEKDRALDKLAGKEGVLRSEIEELEAVSNALEEEIKKLTAASTVKYTGGAFLWPVPGYYGISSEYNPRNSPISGKYEFHTGIDIPASYGSDVVAAADGVVITSGWINGYGNTIMINHGSGIVTLYGHNSSLVVGNGEVVTKGQTVAKIGSTGYSTGNHCHFEVRINGGHTNPWKYLNN